jgi:hypothetical protein
LCRKIVSIETLSAVRDHLMVEYGLNEQEEDL